MEPLPENTPATLSDYLAALPVTLQHALIDPATTQALEELSKPFSLSKESFDKLSDEVMLVLMAVEKPEKLAANLGAALNLDETTANKLASATDDLILNKVKKDIIFFENAKEQEETLQSSPAKEPHDTPIPDMDIKAITTADSVAYTPGKTLKESLIQAAEKPVPIPVTPSVASQPVPPQKTRFEEKLSQIRQVPPPPSLPISPAASPTLPKEEKKSELPASTDPYREPPMP